MKMDYPNHPINTDSRDQAAIRNIQTRLRALLSPDLSVNGVFDSQTEHAVRLFQARHADFRGRPVVIDGVVGSLTWAALMNQPPATRTEPESEVLQRVLSVASSQVGVREIPRDSNRGPDVEKYLASVGLTGGNAWCASFVYWCFQRATEGGNNPCPRTGGVHAMWNRLIADGRLRYAQEQVQARPDLVGPGQLFFLDAGGGLGHVGFVEEVHGAYLTTIEGNTDGSGSREGGGVYRREATRKISEINLGIADVTRELA